MRILYLTQWFEPEPNIVKGIAFIRALEAAGHEVTVVTGFPNYPAGKIYPGYRLRLFQREVLDGVNVMRLPLYPYHGPSALGRSLNFLSFFLSVLAYCLLRRARFDLSYVYHPPITVGLAAALAGMVRPLPLILDVQDLWPDTVAATGMTGAKAITRLLSPLCDFVYRRSRTILTQSEGMRAALIQRSVPAGKIAVVRNWADIGAARPGPNRAHERFRTIVYAGNLGRAQGLETLIEAAAQIQKVRSDIRIKVYGEGVESGALAEAAEAAGLHILTFEGRVPKSEIVGILAGADALLIHVTDDPLFAITIPSKVQFYLAVGRPIVAGISGDAADLLERSGGALVGQPGNSRELAANICRIADAEGSELDAMGRRARSFYDRHLGFDIGMALTLCAIDEDARDVSPDEMAVAA